MLKMYTQKLTRYCPGCVGMQNGIWLLCITLRSSFEFFHILQRLSNFFAIYLLLALKSTNSEFASNP